MKIKDKSLPIYSQLELMIIRWNLDGTKTAGMLTRKILRTFIVKKRQIK